MLFEGLTIDDSFLGKIINLEDTSVRVHGVRYLVIHRVPSWM